MDTEVTMAMDAGANASPRHEAAAAAKRGLGDLHHQQQHQQLTPMHPHGREHLRVLPASANWYCSKICDWGYSDAFGLLLAFGAKDSVFLYQVPLGDAAHQKSASSSAFKQPHKPPITSSTRFFAHLKRGKKDQRVTALQFLNDNSSAGGSSNTNGNGGVQLLCGGEEGGVQVWDVATLKLVAQHRKHGVEVMAVTANPQLNAAFVVAGDRQGRISAWKRNEESVTLFTPIAGDGVFSMEMAPHDKALVAVGYRSGVLCIVDALQGVIRYRLQGHDQEVQNVVWRIPSSNSTEVWLASSSRDRTIKVWKLAAQEEQEEEPSLAQVLTLPKGKQASSYNQSKRLWLPIAWSYRDNDTSDSTGTQKPHGNQQLLRLWSGSFDGNLFAWEWTPSAGGSDSEKTKTKPQACKPIVVKNGHSRLLFNIVSLSPSVGLPADKREFAPSLLSISLDRELRIWKEGDTSAALLCRDKLLGLGGHVYSVAFNPSNEIVASGVGDQTIRLWDVSDAKSANKTKSLYQAELLWKGLQSKVTSVAWHPFQRSLLGYGTEDGQIGVFDIETKKSVRFKSYHSGQVESLQWRAKPQPCHDDEDKAHSDTKSSFVEAMLALESAQADGQSLEDALKDQEGSFGGSGETKKQNELQVLLWSQDVKKQIFESNPEKPDAASKEIKQLGTTAAASSCFAWNARGDQLVVGRENGAVEIFTTATDQSSDSEFVSAQKFHEHEQRVVCLSWCGDVLAAGSQDGRIVVFSLAPSSSPAEQKSPKKLSPALGTLNQQVVGIFTGHSSTITSLRWNAVGIVDTSTDGGDSSTTTKPTLMLASSSNDGSVQVWDMDAYTRVSCFRRHFGRVLSVDWIDRFTLVSGGEDQTIRIWDYHDQQPEEQQQKDGKSVKSDGGGTSHKKIAPKPTPATPKVSVASDSSAAAPTAHYQNENGSERDTAVLNGAAKKSSKPKKKPTKNTTIFHSNESVTFEESLRMCSENLLSSGRSKADENVQAPMFGSSSFAVEEQAYAAEQDWEQLAQVLLLQGKIGDALRVVARESALNASWVAFAPMAGLGVWREITNVYAHQLDAQGDKKNAALHFLSIGKTRAAIKSLVSGHAYHEALALIQSRLGSCDPLFKQTLLVFGAYLEKRGKYVEAAQTLLKIGTPAACSRAVVLLVKTGEISAFETALGILASLKQTGRTTSADGDRAEVEGDCSIPSRVFLDIISKGLGLGNFSLAERAAQFIGTGGGSESSVPTRLTRCFLGVVNEFARHLVLQSSGQESDGDVAPSTDLLLPSETQELFSFLMQHHKRRYSDHLLLLVSPGTFEDSKSLTLSTNLLQGRSKHMWDAMLSMCQENGFWFGASHEENMLEAQELLMDKNYFSYLLALPGSNGTTVAGEKEGPNGRNGSLKAIMGVSHCLLQFLLDVICGYLLSGLEHVRGALEIVSSVDSCSTSASHDPLQVGAGMKFELMSLFFPSGFADPDAPPQIGELAVEVQDTKAFWRSFLLYQCRAALAVYAKARRDSNLNSSVLKDLVGEELVTLLSSDGDEEEDADEFNLMLREQVRTEFQKLSSPASSEEEKTSDKLANGVSVTEADKPDSLSIQEATEISSSSEK